MILLQHDVIGGVCNDLVHYGVSKKDGATVGSGRYPLGSGERPYQTDYEGAKLLAKANKTQEQRDKSIATAIQRMQNRIDRANSLADIDAYSRKIGWDNAKKAGDANQNAKKIKEVAQEILDDDDRLAILGRYTNRVRHQTIGLTTAGSTALMTAGTAAIVGLELPVWLIAVPTIGSAVAIKKGYDYYQKTKY